MYNIVVLFRTGGRLAGVPAQHTLVRIKYKPCGCEFLEMVPT
jgi:hypothetical protein